LEQGTPAARAEEAESVYRITGTFLGEASFVDRAGELSPSPSSSELSGEEAPKASAAKPLPRGVAPVAGDLSNGTLCGDGDAACIWDCMADCKTLWKEGPIQAGAVESCCFVAAAPSGEPNCMKVLCTGIASGTGAP
jgi:hypothetical protein